MFARTTIRFTAALAAVLAIAACGGKDEVEATEDAVSAGVDSMVAGSQLAGGAMSDPDILATVATANAGEIASSELATTKARNAEVKAFARQMIADHQAMQKDADEIATRANLTPQPAASADSARQASSASLDSLKALSGAEFDRAYMAAQVRSHENTLQSLQRFAGAAQNAELKTMLQGAIPKVQAHLDKATQIQAKLGGGTASGAAGGSGSGTTKATP